MPNITNEMTGEDFIVEVNNALDKRGNLGVKGEPQTVNSDIILAEGCAIYYGDEKLDNTGKIRSKLFRAPWFFPSTDSPYIFEEEFENPYKYPIKIFANNSTNAFFALPPKAKIVSSYKATPIYSTNISGNIPQYSCIYILYTQGAAAATTVTFKLNADGTIGEKTWKKNDIVATIPYYSTSYEGAYDLVIVAEEDYNYKPGEPLYLTCSIAANNSSDNTSDNNIVQVGFIKPSNYSIVQTQQVVSTEDNRVIDSNINILLNTSPIYNEDGQYEIRESNLFDLEKGVTYSLDANITNIIPFTRTFVNRGLYHIVIYNPFYNIEKSFGGFFY